MSSSYEEMIKRVVNYRLALEINQLDFGKMLGITQGHYSRVEQGKKVMSGAAVKRLQAHSKDVDFFFTGKRKTVTDLDSYFDRCPQRNRYEFLKLIIWLIDRGFVLEKQEKPLDLSRQLTYLRYLAERHFAANAVWYSIRKANGLTQEEMAERLGINIKKYRAIEKGNKRTNVDAEILSRLYKEFHFPPSLTLGNEVALLADVNLLWESIGEKNRKPLVDILNLAIGLLEEEKVVS